MAKKRKGRGAHAAPKLDPRTKFEENDTFNDSQDEFYDGQDKILLAEEPAAKRRRKLEEEERNLQPSDEEVLSYQSVDEDEEISDVSKDGSGYEDEGDERDWGASKSDYYNADVIETEADALEEEAEARRLQQRQIIGMAEADFGFDENAWSKEQSKSSQNGPVIEKLPEQKVPAKATAIDKLNILWSRYPEFGPLAQEFQDLQVLWKEQQKSTEISLESQALALYLGTIAMYFVILAKDANAQSEETNITALAPADLQDHAVIDNLMRARQTWDEVKDLNLVALEEQKPLTQTLDEEHGSATTTETPLKTMVVIPKKRIRRRVKTEPENKKKGHESKRLDLPTLLATQTDDLSDESDFGDEDPLTADQAEEKAKKKKSLRFYTSQIAQKANRRGAASREAGGDDDIPRKERLRDRQERLLKEAEKRGQDTLTMNEQLGSDEDTDGNTPRGDDEYYQSLVARSNQKKAQKQAKADAYAEASRQGGHVFEEEQIGPDGKRAITYAIEKNKGLMPKRNKDVRNPRVKKRKKYEEKKKKLASTRQVYKGGEGRGGYGGELTGIKTNIVKSVKL